MNMLKVIEKRKSIRDYKDKTLDAKDVSRIEELMRTLPAVVKDQSIEVVMLENGKDTYEKLNGIAGYNGIMITAPHYLVILGYEGYDNDLLAGYVGEWMMLNLIRDDVGSCWVDVNSNGAEVKERLALKSEKTVLALVAVGYGDDDIRISSVIDYGPDKTASPITKLGYPNVNLEYKEDNISSRKSIEEIVYLKKWGNTIDADELKRRGIDEVLYYMRLAPSWGNRQPWKFILDGERIILVIEKADKVNVHEEYIEAGIAMIYFEVAMHGQGLPGKWTIKCEECEKGYDIPDGYFVAGHYGY